MSYSNNAFKKISNPPPKPRHTSAQKVKIRNTPMYIDDNDSPNEEDYEGGAYDYEQAMIAGRKGLSRTTYRDNEDEDDDYNNDKKSKTKNDYGIQGFDIDDDEEDEKENSSKKKKKKKVVKKKKKKTKKLTIDDDENNDDENDDDDIGIKKKKKKKTKKSTINVEENNEENEEDDTGTKKKKKKKKKVVKKKKKKTKDEDENNQKDENEEDDENPYRENQNDDDIYPKDNEEENQNEEEINTNIDKNKDNNNDYEDNYNNNNSEDYNNNLDDDYNNTYNKKNKTQKNKLKVENQKISPDRSTQKTQKTSQNTDFPYEFNEKRDCFTREGILIKTILNSEEAAIKKCILIRNELLKDQKQKWTDPDFGGDSRKSIYGEMTQSPGEVKPEDIEWYSINRIDENAQFFENGIESNDVIQGCLGDCWFISALSVIATKDYLLQGEMDEKIMSDEIISDEELRMLTTGVYPPLFFGFQRFGIFCFKFFKNFKWRYVLVDDRLPCNKIYNSNQTPTLLYGRCRSRGEFWVPLIEKAYAKLHGSYKSLVSGFIDDGLVDLTGLTSKKMIVNRDEMKNTKKIEELWSLLKHNSELVFREDDDTDDQESNHDNSINLYAKITRRNKTMMGCSVDPNGKFIESEVVIDNNHTGVLVGHAYSILDVFTIPKPQSKKKRKESRLLRIRNPWGRKEWTGKWSDESNETRKNKQKIEDELNKKYKDTNERISLSQEDGTFLMCFSDFRRIFNKIFICYDFNPKKYVGVRITGKWTKNESGGLPLDGSEASIKSFCTNPQYFLQIENKSKVCISLLQNDGRLSGKQYPFEGVINKACLLLFTTNVKKPVTNLNTLKEKTLIVQRRDINLELSLNRGTYIIIPSTIKKGQIGDYCLEIYLEDRVKQGEATSNKNMIYLQNSEIRKLGGQNAEMRIIAEYLPFKQGGKIEDEDDEKQAAVNKNNIINFVKNEFDELVRTKNADKEGEAQNTVTKKNDDDYDFEDGYV